MLSSELQIIIAKAALLTYAACCLAGCSLELKKDEDDEQSGGSITVIETPIEQPYPGSGDTSTTLHYLENEAHDCSAVSMTSSNYYATWYHRTDYVCKEDEDFRWRTSCQDSSCKPLSVYVHYVLTQDLGDDQTVHIEAFDNQQFSGYPQASVEIQGFEAKAGEHEKAELFLKPGEYYLRAYLRTDDTDPAPYAFNGMQLVADEPVGIFGAASGAEKVVVHPKEGAEPVHITLDKLFEDPSARPDTKARVRLQLGVAEEHQSAIPVQRHLVIAFFSDDDFLATPVASFTMASELLKVEGQVGRADYVTPSMTSGRYTVRVFLDNDGDELLDAGELAATHMLLGAPALIEVKADHTEELSLSLTPAS